MNNNLELIYWTNNGGVELPLEDWQYKVIAQVLRFINTGRQEW